MEKRIVLTGGPGSGKTTVINNIIKIFSSLGVKVIVVPETATEIITSGIKPFGEDPVDMLAFQELVMKQQLNKEKVIDDAVKMYTTKYPDKDFLIIYDRGTIDNKSYITDEEFMDVLKKVTNKNNYSELLNKYDLVIGLVGAKEFYTLENNSARSESPDYALKLGERTLKSWVGHPKLKIVGPKEHMEDKVNEVANYINELLNKKAVKNQRKYLVDLSLTDLKYISENATPVYIKQVYLKSNNNEEKRLRKTVIDSSPLYELTIYEYLDDGRKVLKSSKKLDEKMYNELLSFKIEGSKVISKYRLYFSYQETYMYLDLFEDGIMNPDDAILEINVTDNENIVIPPFIKVVEEVSNNHEFDNYSKSIESNNKKLKRVIS